MDPVIPVVLPQDYPIDHAGFPHIPYACGSAFGIFNRPVGFAVEADTNNRVGAAGAFFVRRA
jgi:hypothetical protein